MRVLAVHAEQLSFAVTTGPLPADAPDPEQPADTDDEADGDGTDPPDGVRVPREADRDECLVALVAASGGDAADPERVATRAADYLRERAADLRVDGVVVYPFDHLVTAPADRETTVAVCRALGAALAADPADDDRDGADGTSDRSDEPGALDVVRAPVGWHRRFTVRTTGHPFAESVAAFHAWGSGPDATDDGGENGTTDRGGSDDGQRWRVHTLDGERRPTDELDDATRAVLSAAADGPPSPAPSPPSDPPPAERLVEPDGLGGSRVLPAGRQVADLVTALVRERAVDGGASPVRTPATYDLTDPAVARAAGTLGEAWFGGREGGAPEERRGGHRVRPSTRLGVRSLVADADPAAADLPLRVVETGPVRRASGDTVETVPSLGVATGDGDAARRELAALAVLAADCLDALGLDVVPVCHAGPSVSDDRLATLARALDHPLPVARTADDGDGDGADVALRLQGVRDGQPSPVTARLRLDATPGLDALPAGGALLHCEPVGDLGRVLRALDGVDPLPPWLAPTTVRFVTVAERHVDRALELASRVEAAGCRADVDARPRPVGERLDAARAPFLAVVGDREADGEPVKLLDRREGVERSLPVAELPGVVDRAVGDRPRRRRYLPRRVGDRDPLRGGTAGQ